MKLSERLKQTSGDTPEAVGSNTVTRAHAASDPRGDGASDPLVKIRERAQAAVLARLGPALWDPTLSAPQLDHLVVQELSHVIKEEKIPLTPTERDGLVSSITDQVLGYGPIERYLDDPTVTEIMVNALDGIYVERDGLLELTEAAFLSHDHILRVIDRIVAPLGRRIDESSPMVDARLPDGSRVNAVISPLAIDGPMLTIRKFPNRAFELDELEQNGTLTPAVALFLGSCVAGRANILVSGGTGTGKTTLLNVLSGMIPEGERIVTIEDAAELRLRQRHVVRLEGRPANVEGRGEVVARDLVRNALRMRPDRIVVGEVRGAEALDMLQAMNTGHDGSLSTLHANSPRDALARIETMVLMAGVDLPVRAIREQAASALDLMIHISRLRDGSRRVTRVCCVDGMEGDVITLVDLFAFEHRERDDDGFVTGALRATGLRPRFEDKLRDLGIDIPAEVYDSHAELPRSA